MGDGITDPLCESLCIILVIQLLLKRHKRNERIKMVNVIGYCAKSVAGKRSFQEKILIKCALRSSCCGGAEFGQGKEHPKNQQRKKQPPSGVKSSWGEAVNHCVAPGCSYIRGQVHLRVPSKTNTPAPAKPWCSS